MEQHLKLLGILFIVSGVFSILIGFLSLALLSAVGILTGQPQAVAILTIVGTVAAAFCFVTGVPEIIGGWGLLKKRSWSRILVIIMAIINIFSFPLGTALGVYALWVLFKPEAEQMLTE